MTTFLHGGNVNQPSPANQHFFRTILELASTPTPHILCIYFARPEDRWAESYQADIIAFHSARQTTQSHPRFEYADPNLTIFPQQLEWADIIYINGGSQGYLKRTLLDVENLPQKIENKLVVGISAGANILASYYYSTAWDEIRSGIGLLPIKLLCHYNPYDQVRKQIMEEFADDLPLITIPEQQFIIYD